MKKVLDKLGNKLLEWISRAQQAQSKELKPPNRDIVTQEEI